MPYAKRSYRRRSTRSRAYRARPRAYVARRVSWWKGKAARRRSKFRSEIGNSALVKLKYSESFAFGGAAYYDYAFRGAGCYDPYYSGVGGSCSGFAKWAALYRYYTVLGCKAYVEVVNNTTDYNLMCGLLASKYNEAPIISDAADVKNYLRETPNAVSAVGQVFRNGANVPVQRFKMFRRTKYMVPTFYRGDPSVSSATSSNPTTDWQYHVLVTNGGSSASDAGILSGNFRITLTYYVKFQAPKTDDALVD